MIRPMQAGDREAFLELAHTFYHSDAVLHPIPDAHLEKSFDLMTQGSPYMEGYMVEANGECAGYAIVSLTYSNEAGGIVVWLEELYISPAFQGKGLGGEFFDYIERQYAGRAARIRLEAARGNAGAIRLYQRRGYREFDYYQMVKDLAPGQ